MGGNITIKDDVGAGVFFMSGEVWPTTKGAVIKYFDFGAGTVTPVMGQLGVIGYTPDCGTPGCAVTASIAGTCVYHDRCFVNCRQDQDRLYFSEGARIRYITSPSNPAASTLTTLYASAGDIFNFTLRPDGSQLFYVRAWIGDLRCHDITSGKAWCNDATIGPPTGISRIDPVANQFTWLDNDHLFISNAKGEVYLYTLRP